MYLLINETCCICFNNINIEYTCKICNCFICIECIEKMKGRNISKLCPQCREVEPWCKYINKDNILYLSNSNYEIDNENDINFCGPFCVKIFWYVIFTIYFVYTSGLFLFTIIQISIQLKSEKKINFNTLFVIEKTNSKERNSDLIQIFLFTPLLLGSGISGCLVLLYKCKKMICG